MKTMETELQRMDEELYTMYLHSRKIAERTWLPYIMPKRDSSNAYPHIRGVMKRINSLLYDHEGTDFSLSCSELYILLSAITMHDIGKGIVACGEETEYLPGHAYDSYKIVKEHWADLGLPTEKVAGIVANICWFHDCPDDEDMEELYTKYYISQAKNTEPIRGRLLGALLFLGDHMDNTFERTMPFIFKEGRLLDIVGRFRSKIADVRLDRQYKMIKEILDRTCFESSDIYGQCTLKGDLFLYLSQYISQDRPGKRVKTTALYTIAKDAINNEREIARIKDELNIMGMPVKKWLIECDEHLFQVCGMGQGENEVIYSMFALEPLIKLDYCLEVLKGICLLSGGIFAQRFFRYRELTNFIREEEGKEYKVKCAVRRLSLLLKAFGILNEPGMQGEDGRRNYEIYYDENNWSFYCRDEMETEEEGLKDKDHKEIVYNRLKGLIVKKLGENHG